MPPKRGEGAAKGQIHEGNIELSVWSCWTAKLLLRAKVDAAKIDPKGKFISIDIDDDETAKPLFNTASSPSALIAAVEALPRCWMNCTTMQEAVPIAEVLKLLRAAPTEAVEDPTK